MFEGILVDIPFATFFLSKLKQNLRAPRLIPWGLEVNGKVNPLVALRGLELVTLGSKPKAGPTELHLRVVMMAFLVRMGIHDCFMNAKLPHASCLTCAVFSALYDTGISILLLFCMYSVALPSVGNFNENLLIENPLFCCQAQLLNDLPSLDPELYRHLIFLKVMSLHLSPTHFLCYSFCEYCSYYYFCTLILPIYCDLQHFEGDLSELELYFVIVNNEYGEQTEEELLPGGKNIRVTNENVITFIHLIANHRLNFQIRQQSTHFLRGFQQLIQRDWIEMFDEHELQLLISGSLDGLDVDDLRSNTNYAGGYHSAGHVAWAEGSNFNQGHVAVSQLLKLSVDFGRNTMSLRRSGKFSKVYLGKSDEVSKGSPLVIKGVTRSVLPLVYLIIPIEAYGKRKNQTQEKGKKTKKLSKTTITKEVYFRFVTGCSRGPLLGFKYLEPLFCIQRAAGSASEEALDRLPTSATCMNLLKLPPYRSKEQMATKLLYAINADAGFDLS
ncbi:E3 ubiquitin-protein ligase UPL6 [Vitis vinifera]|uniref:HECT-type E3 ubiquitin transferase n=1 Tax=Vitis vinifera TaxID=29760 RepID=A0A438CTE5_VITVI|nr:E3 ubiquitin-protein ligase UPL6 [Vitis vinifera]